ncbi:uncharacterized protein LOC136082626 [Hydra vulgaris]|uniref:Uncharacterized protein LOC136082626 n=1 Tax=Hydra vulgaris TaxID=6087 RepID=A0ABM4C908_HYDVU
MASLVKKKKIRNGHRVYLIRLFAEIDDDLKEIKKINLLLTNIETKHVIIKTLDDEIMDLLADEDDIISEIEDTSSLTSDILSNIENLRFLSKEVKESEKDSSTRSFTSKISMKLPKLTIQSFSGDILSWKGFWDQFSTAIDSNEDLSDIAKFNYLKSYLSGRAQKLIEGLTLSEGNYREAIQLLKDRFGNTQSLIAAHMDDLQKINPVRNLKEVKQLRQMYDKLEINIRNLKDLNVETCAYGSLLIAIILERIPRQLCIIISRHFKNDDWNLNEFMNVIMTELTALERCEAVTNTSIEVEENIPITLQNMHINTKKNNHHHLSNNQRYFNYNTVPRNNQETRDTCVFCKERHLSSRCRNITDVKHRRSIVQKESRCFVCLKRGHKASFCRLNYECIKCKKKHNITLCDTESNKVPNKLLSEVQSYSITHQNQHTATNNHVILQSAKATATNPDNTLSSCIRVLFDGCSHRTYITDALREKLKLKKISTESLIIKRFASDEGLIKTLDVVRVCLKGRDPKNNIYIEALCIPFICSPLKNLNFNLLQQKYVYLKGIPLAKSYPLKNNESVDILVGLDYYYSTITGKIIRGCNNGPVALESILGWIVCGPSDIGVRENFIQTNLVSTSQSDDDVLRLELRKFWEPESSDFQEQDNFYQQFKNDNTFNGEQHVTKLPLKPNCEFLPDNYNISLKRFISLQRMFEINNDLKQRYQEVITSYENENIIERIYDPGEPGKVHYLPHRAVLRDDKETTKLRVVFDGSAKEGGPSINENRTDIRQAFLNVGICNEHKDLLRFLWYDDKNNMLIIYRFLRVVFGITSSPVLLNTTIIKHMENYSDTLKEFTKKFLRDLYVDDSTVGVNAVSEGIQFYNFIKEAMKKGGFNLRKWFSNSPELSRYIADKEKEKALLNEEDSYAKFELNRSNDMEVNCVKVLGLLWNGKTDEFHFNFSAIVQEALNLPFTKRNLLRVGAKFYDPLGLISPIVIVTKLLFQALCIDKLDWDDKLPSEIHEKWLAYLKGLEVISSITVPRYCFKEQDEIAKYVTLHGFSDSSQVAYSAVIYAQVKTKEGWMSKLIASKTKVAPIKKLTIPRLELLGCLLLANLMHKVVQKFKDVLIVEKICYWTDSEISLSWIKNSKRDWKLWVQHRVSKIQELSSKKDWSYIEGENNPADIPTRDLNLLTFQANCLWWEGPLFLKTNITPKQRKYFDSNMVESISELKSSVTTCVNYIDEPKDGVQYIIKAEKFSSLTQLLRVSAYGLRFGNNIKNKVVKYQGELTTKEINSAEELWIKSEQSLLKGENDSSQDYENIKQQLDLFIDEHNILRLKRRFENSLLEYAEKYPIILRSYSHFTKLIVLAAYERCKRVLAKTLHGPGPPNLPIFRVATHKFAFTNIGLDYAGPLFVKNIYGQENSLYKAYKFILPKSPWWGGFYEQLIRVVKDALKKCVGKIRLSYEELETVLHEIEMTVNSRPLTYIYDEVYEPLTPSHLVIGRRLQTINVKTQMDDSQIDNSDDHNSRLKYLKTIIDHYWKRFCREYIAQLRERHLYDSKNQRKKCGEYLQVGDVVLINDDQLKRNLWKQGVVEELIISNDKRVRGAILKTCINGHVSFIKRPLQRLVPLEVVKIKNTEKVKSAEPKYQMMAAITAELKRKFNT